MSKVENVAGSSVYRISRGDKNSAVCRNVDVTWEKVCKVLSVHKVASSKEEMGWFCGGTFKDNYRNGDNLESRSLLTIDVDECEMGREEIEFELEMLGYGLVAYTTWRSSPSAYRYRVVVPLSREVSSDEYVTLMGWFTSTFSDIRVDDSSHRPAQFMYMPSVSSDGVDGAFSVVLNGPAVDVESVLSSGVKVEGNGALSAQAVGDDFGLDDDGTEDDDNSLELALAHTPLDISNEEVDAYLDALVESAGDYSSWITVGQALHHQYRASEYGKLRWMDWSASSDKYDERVCENKWRSFTSTSRSRPLTFATVIKMVKDSGVSIGVVLRKEVGSEMKGGGLGVSGVGGGLSAEVGREVDCEQAFEKLKRKLSKIPAHVVALTKRQQIAQDIYEVWGKSEGMTKAAIFRELCPIKKGSIVSDVPSWVRDWVFVEKSCEYHDLENGYSIKREAFNAKFDRMDECIVAERSASSMALTDWQLPTAVDKMYFPNADKLFKYEDMWYVNAYKKRGVEPCVSLEDDGAEGTDGLRVIDKMLRHLEFTLVDKKEREILLDWMSHLVQNIGSRINWAILLQGTQGGGKTYFTRILQGILGSNATQLDPHQFTKGTFSGWAYGSVLNIVEEIRISGDNRWAIIDRMKPFITNDTIQIEEKFADSRTVPNFTSYFLLTNYQDALPITNGDRRYCVLYSRCQSEDQLFDLLGGELETNRYFEDLFKETDRRMDAICYYFMNRKISDDFAPKGRAPKTLSREKMIGYSVSHESDEVRDLINHYQCGVINDDIVDITYLMRLNAMEFEVGVSKLPKTSALTRILLQLGYTKINNRIYVHGLDDDANGVKDDDLDGSTKAPKAGKVKIERHTIWHKNQLKETFVIEKVKDFFQK